MEILQIVIKYFTHIILNKRKLQKIQAMHGANGLKRLTRKLDV